MNSDTQTNFNFQQFFLKLLEILSEREREVLIKRHQLTSNLEKRETLKQIGDTYGITRERVRQIEREAINKVVKQTLEAKIKNEIEYLKNELFYYLERKGGIACEEELIREHALAKYDFDELHLNSYLFILHYTIDEVNRVDENEDFYSFWHLNQMEVAQLTQFIDRIVGTLNGKKPLTQESELHELIESEALTQLEKDYFEKFTVKHSDLNYREIVKSFINVTKKIEKNILNHWGLSSWVEIRPKKLSDKIALILQKNNDPLHFRDVAEHINKASFDRKKVCAATVHNELISNDKFVLIGRGIYALKDWGYVAGTVSDVVDSILSLAQKPLSKDEIYQEVLKQRKVNPSTIYLSLINKSRFKKLTNGLFVINK